MTLRPITIEDELRRTFELASLRKEATGLRTASQWAAVVKLQGRCAKAFLQEKASFARRYDTRVEIAYRRLLGEAGRPGMTLQPSWASADRFSPDAILRQAQREVRHAHQQRIDRIKDFERRQLSVIVERSRRENRLQGMARDDFNHATDRRAGIENRRRVRQREH